MNRTLGISARMDYVTNGVVNEYSTKFPYRVSENISQLQFTWSNPAKTSRYLLKAVSEQFDVLPVLLFPSEGIVPRKSQNFVVEYRCVGSRSGQFQVHLHFNISTRPPLQFTLKQEKICSYIEGRRAFAGDEDDANGSSSLIAQIFHLPIVYQLLLAFVLLSLFLCLLLLCCCYCLHPEDPKGQFHEAQSSAAAFHRRSRIGSLYAASRSSIRAKLHKSIRHTGGLAVAVGSPANSGGHITRTTSSLAASTAGDDTSQPFMNSPDSQMPSTSSAAFPAGNRLRVPLLKGQMDRIVYERPEAQLLDVNQALVDLYADRNLFEQAHMPEMEGQFGHLVWASWRQIGSNGNRPVVDDVDDEEDDAKDDKALICKTLKPGADRVHFVRFLRNALQFHHVPPHAHLAQVIAAATFGNFANPESVKDLPLICYAHNGFGLLKKFLHTCREQQSNGGTEMDRVSLAAFSIAEMAAINASTSNDALKECTSSSLMIAGGTQKQQFEQHEKQRKPRIVITKTPSSALTAATTLRTHDLVSIATQLASAVRHLHKFGIIHKDIATRNCLVSRMPLKFGPERLRLNVQLCDSALGRDLFPNDYAIPFNVLNNNKFPIADEIEPCPIRWMAPELLGLEQPQKKHQGVVVTSKQNNSATDMWAFGVLMWELFTCAEMPYEGMHTDELAQAIVYAGLRLSQPYNCPDELYDMMCQCWCVDPEGRPTAAELDLKLLEFMNCLRKYI